MALVLGYARLGAAWGVRVGSVTASSALESPQPFGEVEIDGDSAELTVRLRAEGGGVLFTRVLRPGRVGQ